MQRFRNQDATRKRDAVIASRLDEMVAGSNSPGVVRQGKAEEDLERQPTNVTSLEEHRAARHRLMTQEMRHGYRRNNRVIGR